MVRAWSGDRHGATGLGIEVSSDLLALEATGAPEADIAQGVGRADGPGKLELRQASTGLPIANRHLLESRSPHRPHAYAINPRTTREQRANNRRRNCVSKHQRVSIGIAPCGQLSYVRAGGLHVCRLRPRFDAPTGRRGCFPPSPCLGCERRHPSKHARTPARPGETTRSVQGRGPGSFACWTRVRHTRRATAEGLAAAQASLRADVTAEDVTASVYAPVPRSLNFSYRTSAAATQVGSGSIVLPTADQRVESSSDASSPAARRAK